MATRRGSEHIACESCGWRGHRVPRDPMNPNRSEEGGFGRCPRCDGSRLRRLAIARDKKAAKARAEWLALAGGGRV